MLILIQEWGIAVMLTLVIDYSEKLRPTIINFEKMLNSAKLQTVQASYHYGGVLKCTINAYSESERKTVERIAGKLFGDAVLGAL